jgi:DNA-binding beta-propeller fold protein YncE
MADRIRKINVQTSEVHAVITTASLPAGAVIDGMAVSLDGTIYATDIVNDVVYKIYEDGRVLGALVGKIGLNNDVASSGMLGSDGNTARLDQPYGVCVDASGNIYVADSNNHKIKRISPSGRSQTLAGSGVDGDVCGSDGLSVQLSGPAGIAVDKAGVLYVCDSGNHKIKKIWPSGKTVSLAGGTGGGMANGQGSNALFSNPTGICVDFSENCYVLDRGNRRVRKIDSSGNVVTLAGGTAGFVDGSGNSAQFGASTWDIAMDPSGQFMFIIDQTNDAIRKLSISGTMTTFMHWEQTTGTTSSLAFDKSGFLYILEKNV